MAYTNIDVVICAVLPWFTGNLGMGLATIAVTVVGVGALLGKVSWGTALNVGIGVSVIFGAAAIVDLMGVESPLADCIFNDPDAGPPR
jgi:type IV secretory pathway VirB2 component (pilin)